MRDPWQRGRCVGKYVILRHLEMSNDVLTGTDMVAGIPVIQEIDTTVQRQN